MPCSLKGREVTFLQRSPNIMHSKKHTLSGDILVDFVLQSDILLYFLDKQFDSKNDDDVYRHTVR